MMLTAENRRELEEKGFTVVQGVLTEDEADEYRGEYEAWVKDNFEPGTFPDTMKSLIHRYKIGHLATTWRARLKCKPVFAQLWGTERLMTSMDAVAIGRPPEDGEEPFWFEDKDWLHIDHTARRRGLHSYQAGLYLETADTDDWTLGVMEGSHRQFDQFWAAHPEDYKRSLESGDYTRLKVPEHVDWMRAQGCEVRRVPAPKGSLVLWDSRLVHHNANPLKGRRNPGRWRYVVIMCMGPANWATQRDLDLKRQAYDEMVLTHHWPSQGVVLFNPTPPNVPAKRELTELPEEARSLEARRLAGVEPYPEAEGEKDVPLPEWHPGYTVNDIKRSG